MHVCYGTAAMQLCASVLSPCTGKAASAALEELAHNMMTTYYDEYPTICDLLKVAIMIPMTIVACEQIFSMSDRIKMKYYADEWY